MVILFVVLLALPASAASQSGIPESAVAYGERYSTDLSSGLYDILSQALASVIPSLREAAGSCFLVLGVAMLCGIFGKTVGQGSMGASNLLGVAAISGVLLQSAKTFLRLGLETAAELTAYGDMLLPVMSGALVASGGAGSAGALYVGTALGNAFLTRLMTGGAEPMLYLFVGTGIASSVVGNDLLKRLQGAVKSVIVWSMKLTLYIFTGYMAITGVISGTADAMAVKAAKLTISGMVPVVGGILSDASEAVLVGAGALRGTAGVGGMLAMLAIACAPFFRVGVQYLLLKLTAVCCGLLGTKEHTALVECFAEAMGMVVGMLGTCSIMQLISVVCFMKGVG